MCVCVCVGRGWSYYASLWRFKDSDTHAPHCKQHYFCRKTFSLMYKGAIGVINITFSFSHPTKTRERERERQTDTDKQRDRHRQTETQTDRETGTGRQTERQRETEIDRDRDTHAREGSQARTSFAISSLQSHTLHDLCRYWLRSKEKPHRNTEQQAHENTSLKP